MFVLALILGLAVGAAGVWLWARGEIARRDERLLAADDTRALVERTQAQWDEQLKSFTNEALTTSSSKLLELAEAKLQPIRETLTKFEEQARALETKRMQEVAAIPQLLKTVTESQELLRKETGNLVTALRAPHVRGRWGEVQLKRVIELAGMVAHCDFSEQQSDRDDEGRLRRPDVVVRLPGGKSIVVDAKVPFAAYADALAADDGALRDAHMARHAAQVREHVRKLGQKRYWEQVTPSPEYVVMFVDEGLFRAALDQDPALFDAGVEAGVIIASPATLVALLRTVAYCWQQETVAESARAVSQLGRDLYKRLGSFSEHFAKIGRSLDTAVGAYNEAIGSFERRVLVSARKFPEFGAGDGELPEIKPVELTTRQLVAPELEPVAEAPRAA